MAPGIDIERDILAHMAFKPIVGTPDLMDLRIFRDAAMGARPDPVRPRPRRAASPSTPARDTLFLNFEGMRVRTAKDVDDIEIAVEGRCREIGHRVPVVVNYDNFRIDPELVDTYAAMVRHMEETCYTQVSRYTGSAFLRLKLGDALERAGVKPHLFERADLGRRRGRPERWRRLDVNQLIR